MASVSQLIGYALLLYVGWRFLRSLFSKSTLDNIPGPPNDSYIKGGSHMLLPHVYPLTVLQAVYGGYLTRAIPPISPGNYSIGTAEWPPSMGYSA